MSDSNLRALEERLLELHARVLLGDRAAVEEIGESLLLPVHKRLHRFARRATGDLVANSTHDAIGVYLDRPEAFDLRRGSLVQFVHGIAANLLRVNRRSSLRRAVREDDYAKEPRQIAEGSFMDPILRAELRAALPRLCSPAELAAMKAFLNDDDTGRIAVHLGVAHLRLNEQRREKKRLYARVVKRLQRLWGANPRSGRSRKE